MITSWRSEGSHPQAGGPERRSRCRSARPQTGLRGDRGTGPLRTGHDPAGRGIRADSGKAGGRQAKPVAPPPATAVAEAGAVRKGPQTRSARRPWPPFVFSTPAASPVPIGVAQVVAPSSARSRGSACWRASCAFPAIWLNCSPATARRTSVSACAMASLPRGWPSRKARDAEEVAAPEAGTWRVRPAPIGAKMKTAPRRIQKISSPGWPRTDGFTGRFVRRFHARKFFQRFVLALAENVHFGSCIAVPPRPRRAAERGRPAARSSTQAWRCRGSGRRAPPRRCRAKPVCSRNSRRLRPLGRFSRTFESNSWAPRSANVSRIWLSMCAAVTSTDCALQVEDHVLARAQFLLEVGVELLRRAEEAALQLDDDRLVAFLGKHQHLGFRAMPGRRHLIDIDLVADDRTADLLADEEDDGHGHRLSEAAITVRSRWRRRRRRRRPRNRRPWRAIR